MDAEDNLELWTPPPPSVPTFFDLLHREPSESAELLEGETATEEVSIEVAVPMKPVLAEGTSASEEYTIGDPSLPEPMSATDATPPDAS